MTEKIIVYGSPICALVPPVRYMLDRADARYEYVNIFRDNQARAAVREINRGHESVPTLQFPDGSTLTEPSMTELQTKLETLGYDVRPATWLERLWLLLESPTARLFGIIFVAIGLSTGDQSLLILAAVILALGIIPPLLRKLN